MGWVTKLDPRRCQFLLPERSRFSQIGHIIFRAVVALKTSVPFTCRFIACSSRIKVCQTDTQTDRPSTVTLAAHARRGLIIQGSIRHSRALPGTYYGLSPFRCPLLYAHAQNNNYAWATDRAAGAPPPRARVREPKLRACAGLDMPTFGAWGLNGGRGTLWRFHCRCQSLERCLGTTQALAHEYSGHSSS